MVSLVGSASVPSMIEPGSAVMVLAPLRLLPPLKATVYPTESVSARPLSPIETTPTAPKTIASPKKNVEPLSFSDGYLSRRKSSISLTLLRLSMLSCLLRESGVPVLA